MVEHPPAGRSRRRLVLALIILIPLIPAVIVQVLVRRSPPGMSITPTMSEIIAAMQALPRPAEDAPKLDLRVDFEAGESFLIDVHRRSRVDEEESRESDVRYRLEVLKSDATGATLRLSGAGPETPLILDREELVFDWDHEGYMVAQLDDGPIIRDLRDALLKRHGLYFPGSFEKPSAEYEWIAPPGQSETEVAAEIFAPRGLVIGREEMPYRGGVLALPEVSGLRPFQVLGYRRYAIEDGGEKLGVYECVQRGLVEAEVLRPQLASGEIRISEKLAWLTEEPHRYQNIQTYSSQSVTIEKERP